MSLWVIAVCAAIWTVRMVLNVLLRWLAAHYRYLRAPRAARWLFALVDGGAWHRV